MLSKCIKVSNMDRKDAEIMKIAVTYENGMIFPHFGHTEQFKVYDTADGKITGTQIVSTNGNGHGALAGFLSSLEAEVLICGGVSGSADEAVNALLAGTLEFDPDVHCGHHGHHEGEHQCGADKHECAGNGGNCK